MEKESVSASLWIFFKQVFWEAVLKEVGADTLLREAAMGKGFHPLVDQSMLGLHFRKEYLPSFSIFLFS